MTIKLIIANSDRLRKAEIVEERCADSAVQQLTCRVQGLCSGASILSRRVAAPQQ